jgi:hypothetical protein
VTRFKVPDALAITFLPVGTEPVKEMRSMRMLGHPASELVAAREHVEHAARQRVARHLAHQQRGERRIGRRLQHHRVAGVKPVRDLVRGEDDRKIPRRDGADHADRMIDQLDPVLAVVADHLGFELGRAHGFELMHRAADLPFGLADRLALLARQHRADLVDPLGKSVREIGDRLAALCEAPAAPGAKSMARGGDRVVELLARGVRAFRERLAGCRIDDVEALVAAGRLTVDGVGEVGGVGHGGSLSVESAISGTRRPP